MILSNLTSRAAEALEIGADYSYFMVSGEIVILNPRRFDHNKFAVHEQGGFLFLTMFFKIKSSIDAEVGKEWFPVPMTVSSRENAVAMALKLVDLGVKSPKQLYSYLGG